MGKACFRRQRRRHGESATCRKMICRDIENGRKDSRNEDRAGHPSIWRTDVNVAFMEELVLTHCRTVEKERKNPIYKIF